MIIIEKKKNTFITAGIKGGGMNFQYHFKYKHKYKCKCKYRYTVLGHKFAFLGRVHDIYKYYKSLTINIR